jgi:hypothetical protein
MAKIITKIKNRIRNWFGYYNGPMNIYTGRGFAQGPGFDVSIETFQIKRFGIKFIKDVKVSVDPAWLDNLKGRLEETNIK